MCGRYTLAVELEPLMDFFSMNSLDFDYRYRPRFNVAPTDFVLTYGADGPQTGAMMRWGLIPSWRNHEQKLPIAINARAESVATNSMFQRSFERHRCLVLADGYYEWKKEGRTKRPFRIGLKRWEPFGFAGLWDEWQGPKGPVRSCTIITTKANELTKPLHARMPVILPVEAHARWLDQDNRTGYGLRTLLVPYASDGMEVYEVSQRVNAVMQDAPSLINASRDGEQGFLTL